MAKPRSRPKAAQRAPQAAPGPLLELSTAPPERKRVVIDGKSYELAVRDEFGIQEMRRFEQRRAEVNRLNIDDLSEEDARNLGQWLTEMVSMIVRDLPKAVLAKLNDGQKYRLVIAFTETLAPGAMEEASGG